MFRAKRRIFLLAAALSVLAAPAAAPAQAQQPPQTPTPEDAYITTKTFQNRVFEVRNRDPHSLLRVLEPLGSGFKGAVMSANTAFRTITVRDFPENLALVEAAIRRFDQPEPARPGIEFRVHFLLASNEDASAGQLPQELGEVARQLQSSLGFKNFTLLGSQVLRSKEGGGLTHNKGLVDVRPLGAATAAKTPTLYSYHIRDVRIETPAGAPARVLAEEFNFQLHVPVTYSAEKQGVQTVSFQSPVSLRDGERVVAGTASIADRSVVVVLSVTTIK